jgi:predicted DNA binding CopG/RHH family protein
MTVTNDHAGMFLEAEQVCVKVRPLPMPKPHRTSRRSIFFNLQFNNAMQTRTIKNPNRNGRPKKSVAVKKSHKITVKLSMPEYYALKGRAKEAGLNRSEYIRQCFVKGEIKQRLQPEHLDHIRKLSGMANNLNQLVHRANAYGYGDAFRLNMAMAEELDNIIKLIAHDS